MTIMSRTGQGVYRPKYRKSRPSRKEWLRQYRAHLDSPAWRSFRTDWFKRHPRAKCWVCGAKRNLQLHHLRYDRVGQERDSDVVALCTTCHEGVHKYAKRNKLTVAKATPLFKKKYRSAAASGGTQPPKDT